MNKGNKFNNHKPSIVSSISRLIIFLITVTILLQGIMWILDTTFLFKSDIENIENIQTDYIKTDLKGRVDTVISYANYRQSQSDTQLKTELKNKTYEAYSLMLSLYNQYKNTQSQEEITQLIVAALKDIRFNDGQGYFFIDTLEGDVILYPPFPESQGTNLIDLQDDEGNYTLQDEINLVKEEGEGYIDGYWKKPNPEDPDIYKKTTFVKGFEPYGWYLGCGVYVDDITNEIKKEIIDYVNTIQYGEDNTQYVFIHNYDGVEVANGLYPEFIGVNNYDLQDSNGAYVIREQIDICIHKNGGFLTHYWPQKDNAGEYKKLTYVTNIPEWQWVIGSGKDISSLEADVLSKQKQLERTVIIKTGYIILVLIVLIGVSYIAINVLIKKLKNNLIVFQDFMTSSKKQLTEINGDDMDFDEFKDLASVTNMMTNRINQLLTYDELTKVLNRRSATHLYDDLCHQYKNNKISSISIAVFDIDYFKNINDKYGHPVGDIVLAKVAEIMSMNISKDNYLSRFGGEEFVLMMPDTSKASAVNKAELIRKSIESYAFDVIEERVTISGGVSNTDEVSINHLIGRADEQMYLAKNSGRNKISF